MNTLAEIEAAVDQLPPDELEQLFLSLCARVKAKGRLDPSDVIPRGTHSVLDFPPSDLGKMLKPFSRDDDFFDEMLEGRGF